MTVKLFPLSGVPFEEAEDIRCLLGENNISFYETPSENWGLDSSALWLNDDSQLEDALNIINQYQEKRRLMTRNDELENVNTAANESLLKRFKKNSAKISLFVLMFLVASFSILISILSIIKGI